MSTLQRLALLALPALALTASETTSAMDMASMPGMKMAGDNTQSISAGPYRIELHVLPPEPFYTAQEVTTKHLTAGMLVVRGAHPVSPDASPAPDHHLIVHVFRRDGGKPVADATVTISFRKDNGSGRPAGSVVRVPVVVMQAIGGGPASTHYGNNVRMGTGSYTVTAAVNGTPAIFHMRM